MSHRDRSNLISVVDHYGTKWHMILPPYSNFTAGELIYIFQISSKQPGNVLLGSHGIVLNDTDIIIPGIYVITFKD